jgi:hypothetical protein
MNYHDFIEKTKGVSPFDLLRETYHTLKMNVPFYLNYKVSNFANYLEVGDHILLMAAYSQMSIYH